MWKASLRPSSHLFDLAHVGRAGELAPNHTRVLSARLDRHDTVFLLGRRGWARSRFVKLLAGQAKSLSLGGTHPMWLEPYTEEAHFEARLLHENIILWLFLNWTL